MGILEEIRKEKVTSNWFMNQDNWYKFDEGTLYTQDKSKNRTRKHSWDNKQNRIR